MKGPRREGSDWSVAPDISPYLTELVVDMWALGCTPQVGVDLLRPLELPAESTRLLDLGCGKGALGITVAKELGFRVRGVDLCDEFLREAVERAKMMGVSRLCEFEQRDVRDVLAVARGYDIAVLASLGGLLGRFDRCIGSMRRAVRPGGFLVLDDGFLSHSEAVRRPGYGHLASHDRTVEYLHAHGDAVVRERIYTPEATRAINLDYIDHISKRAEGVADRHPEAAAALRTYIASQESECDLIDREVTGAIWILQRA